MERENPRFYIEKQKSAKKNPPVQFNFPTYQLFPR